MKEPVSPGQTDDVESSSKVTGAQTLSRGLALLECVAQGITDAKSIAEHLSTPRSTAHRILNCLVSEGYLHHVPYHGYSLGYKLIYLGTRAREQRPLSVLAQPYLEELATFTGDTVHLGTLDGNKVFYLGKVSGGKGLEMRSRIGQHVPVASTGVGKALMLGLPQEQWRSLYDQAVIFRNENAQDSDGLNRPGLIPWPEYQKTMRHYFEKGWVMDLEENELGIRCVGAPIHDVNGEVVAAVSVASALFYMPEERMLALGPRVFDTANKISQALGAGKK